MFDITLVEANPMLHRYPNEYVETHIDCAFLQPVNMVSMCVGWGNRVHCG